MQKSTLIKKISRGETQPSRKHPAHLPVFDVFNRSVIVFVTVCVKDRRPLLANPDMHKLLCRAWELADHWTVGRYVIMPDHVHLFCAPGKCPPTPLKNWIEYWKSIVARACKGHGSLSTSGGAGSTPSAFIGEAIATLSQTGRGRTRPSKLFKEDGPDETGTSRQPTVLWQRDFWDTQLRQGENYYEKWLYVCANPVRAKLCTSPEKWQYQGEMHILMWHN